MFARICQVSIMTVVIKSKSFNWQATENGFISDHRSNEKCTPFAAKMYNNYVHRYYYYLLFAISNTLVLSYL